MELEELNSYGVELKCGIYRTILWNLHPVFGRLLLIPLIHIGLAKQDVENVAQIVWDETGSRMMMHIIYPSLCRDLLSNLLRESGKV